MNISETLQALGNKDIVVGIDVGQHMYCDIDSNCPVAIEVRKIISESGISLVELLEGYESIQPVNPFNVTVPGIEGKAQIYLAGETVEIDLIPFLKGELGSQVSNKIQELERIEGQLQSLGRGFYQTYQEHEQKLRQKTELPMVTYSARDLAKYQMFVTSTGNEYLFHKQFVYSPEYVITAGVRYQISAPYQERIKRDAWLRISSTRDFKLMRPVVMDETCDHYLEHYHGNSSGDCWGSVKLPSNWNGNLNDLDRTLTGLIMPLKTVNKDSPLNIHPRGMPELQDLFEHSKRLGREGEVTKASKSRTTREREGVLVDEPVGQLNIQVAEPDEDFEEWEDDEDDEYEDEFQATTQPPRRGWGVLAEQRRWADGTR